ncbi:MAG: DUF3881 family protein [Lachnospiraceae bacterium]|nr:DUF3881 family protein [Lachnospiraceae bacterium]MBQ5560903.1 DUF3881 family protein [Lachnospiraceae bacterium]MCR4803764.1 DUF3881 family protein [Lachnospiraceae bacterium]
MHSYLRAIGFSNVKNRSDFEKILGIVMNQPTEKTTRELGNKIKLAELKKDFMKDIGIGIVGEYDEKGFFYLGHYFPYCRGNFVSATDDVCINKRVDTDAYTGMYDDMRFGVSMIFYLQNIAGFIQNGKMIEGVAKDVHVSMSALSVDGKIILGLEQSERQLRHSRADSAQRKRLIAEAKQGNQEAIDSLTIEDIDIYAMVSRRVHNEDLYSIVENTFIPYGSESDNYSILATIKEYSEVVNPMTQEELYVMTLECNDMIFNLCMNKKDLLGVPMVGARFKGSIWMQGFVREKIT